MAKNELIIGKKLSLSLIDELLPDEEKSTLTSQVVDIISEEQFCISCPMYMGYHISLYTGDKIKIQFSDKQGLFVVKCEVIASVTEKDVRIYSVKQLSKPIRLQRRQHYRINTHLAIVYNRPDVKEVYRQGLISDISGGGIRFLCKDELNVGEFLNIFFTIGYNIEFRTSVKIIRISSIDTKKYEVGAVFAQLSYSQREKLVKYVFNTQIEKLKSQYNK